MYMPIIINHNYYYMLELVGSKFCWNCFLANMPRKVTTHIRPGWWDDDDFGDTGDDSSGSEDESNPSKFTAARELLELLVHLRLAGVLSSKILCIICWWCWKAGVAGPLRSFAKAPGDRSTGNYEKVFERAMGFKASVRKHQVILKVPGYGMHTHSRMTYDVGVVPVHECLHDEIISNDAAYPALREAIADRTFPDSYFEHPFVAGGGDEWFPCAVYFDAAPYIKRDSVLVVLIANLVTGMRHCVALLRKNCMCRCGCAGWCSIWPILNFLKWCFCCLKLGRWPRLGCTGVVWPEDSWRAALGESGAVLALKAFILQIKMDLQEHTSTFAFIGHSSNLFPCSMCGCDKAGMHRCSVHSPHVFPFSLHTLEDLLRACMACEHVVHINYWELLLRVRASLGRVGAKNFKGGTLQITLPDVGLDIGDRIEPSDLLYDYSSLMMMGELPAGGVTVTFWRASAETLVHHRNQFFCEELATSPQTILPDMMHVLFLGLWQSFAARAFRAMVAGNVYNSPAHWAPQAVVSHTLEMMKAQLYLWYPEFKAMNPLKSVSEIQDISIKMVGREARPSMDLKAGETKYFLYFLRDELQKHVAKIRSGAVWAATARAMCAHTDVCDANPWRMGPMALEEHREKKEYQT